MSKYLYIMVGAPGSGKTTYVNQHARNTAVHVSRDRIRFSLLSDIDKYFAKEKETRKQYYDEIYNALHTDWVNYVYADATHLSQKSRRELIEEVFPFGVPGHIRIVPIVMKTSLENCLMYNKLRTGRALVPNSIIETMYKSFAHPKNDSFSNIYYDIQEVDN